MADKVKNARFYEWRKNKVKRGICAVFDAELNKSKWYCDFHLFLYRVAARKRFGSKRIYSGRIVPDGVVCRADKVWCS